MAVQTSNIISTQVHSNAPSHLLPPLKSHPLTQSQIYRDKDKPLYRTGNKVLLGIAAWNFCLFIGAKVYYFWKNKYVQSPHSFRLFSSRRQTKAILGSGTRSGIQWTATKSCITSRLLKTRGINGIQIQRFETFDRH